jgi:G:T-mismatch repair DNA endonuclease (very short patch repair protein)
MITCEFCKKEFKDRHGFGIHLATTEKHQFPAGNDFEMHKERVLVNTLFGQENVDMICQDYIDGKLCTHDIRKSGKDISKLILLLGIKRTSKEERKTKRYKDKYLTSIQKKYGDHITNISQVPEIQKKKEFTFAKKYGSYEKYLRFRSNSRQEAYQKYVGTDKHKETIIKIEDTCEERYGVRNFGAGAAAKAKRIKSHAETVAMWDYDERLSRTSAARAAVCHSGGFSSKPEKRIQHCLTELNIEFEKNVHLWNYNYDMVFEKFIVEVQGDMWHANPLFYKDTDLIMGKIVAKDLWEKDKKKKQKAENNEYELIAIWECDITKKKDEELIEFVKCKLLEAGYVFE